MAVTVQAQRVPAAVPLLHDGSNEFIGRLQEIGLQARGDQRRLFKHLARFQQVLLDANFRAGSKALFAARLAKVEIDLENMKTTNLRVIAAVAGGGVPGAESSMLKIRGTEIRQEILSLIRRAMGVYAVPYIDAAQYEGYEEAPVGGVEEAATAAANYFNYRKLSIFGGSNEIQKNIISKMILGL